MTAQARTRTNGAPKSAPPPAPVAPAPAPATVAERVDILEAQVKKMAAALAGLLAQQMQPQVQQNIFAQLTGSPPAPPERVT